MKSGGTGWIRAVGVSVCLKELDETAQVALAGLGGRGVERRARVPLGPATLALHAARSAAFGGGFGL